MIRRYSCVFSSLLAMSAAAHASPQVCTLGAAAAGSQGTLLCHDARTGAVTQSIALGNTVAGKGGTGGTISHRDDVVLVANQASGAVVFRERGGQLVRSATLDTHGAGTYSGAVGNTGNYLVTATQILFFPAGHSTASSSESLLVADGSVAQVAVTNDYAYVSEKSGTLEAFPLRRDGNLAGPGANVSGVPAGTIVGITALDGLAISPVAHLATNANQSVIPVVNDQATLQLVQTKEVAACWAANDGHEACITNPGSMTISCGQFGFGGFRSYTSAAAHPSGETLLDIDLSGNYVAAVGSDNGTPVITAWSLSWDNGDFLTFVGEVPAGAAVNTGALVIP